MCGDPGLDFRQFAEVRALVRGQDRAPGCARGGGDNQVVCAATSAFNCRVRQQIRMMLSHGSGVVTDRNDSQDFVEESPLRSLAAGVGVKVDTREVFGDDNGGYGNVCVIGNGGSSPHCGDEHTSVKY